jgi:hypothetical protein
MMSPINIPAARYANKGGDCAGICALLVALGALIAAARDQLLKLDILPGVVHVFLLGFGAGATKNLLTPKQ